MQTWMFPVTANLVARQDISVTGLAQGTYIARIVLPDKTITETRKNTALRRTKSILKPGRYAKQ